MSLDGPRQSASQRPETTRHRAAAGRAKSSGLTWILRSWVTGTTFRDGECTVHATKKHLRRQVRSELRRQSGAWLPSRRLTSIFLASNGLQRRMSDLLAQRLSQALGSSFTLEGEIGRGGMGVVYHARDERLKRKVAVKVLPPDLAFREEIRIRFLREAETAARLSHPHIVPIHSVGEGPDGLVYFVMAYVDGESVAAKLKRRGSLPAEESRRIMQETADALGAAHALGIIHRDVKPDNILLEGSRGRVVVTDFGIAKALSSTTGPATLTATGVAIGTPHYMSPEQAAGDREIDGRSDIYSLGVVAYQMLTGERGERGGRRRDLAPATPGGEAAIVRDLRNRFVTWASVCGSLVVIDVATGSHLPGWSLIVAGIWAGAALVPRYVRLWHAGYSWRDVLARPPAPDAMEVRFGATAGGGGKVGPRPADLPEATSGEFGRQAEAIQQARSDRKAILRIMERVPKSEKKLLPDVVATIDGLLNRAEDLARALHAMSVGVDAAALARLQEKLEAIKRQPESAERARQLDLLERQRQTLTDLLTRRQLIEDQIESCVLAMQTVRFDLLRLRSAGVAAVLDDLTHATQQARALSRDVDHAIAAAGEIREALGEQPRA